MRISNQKSGFRTKGQDFGQEIRISDKRSGFRTKSQDSERKVGIPNEKSGFPTKSQDFEQKVRISNKRFRFRLILFIERSLREASLDVPLTTRHRRGRLSPEPLQQERLDSEVGRDAARLPLDLQIGQRGKRAEETCFALVPRRLPLLVQRKGMRLLAHQAVGFERLAEAVGKRVFETVV